MSVRVTAVLATGPGTDIYCPGLDFTVLVHVLNYIYFHRRWWSFLYSVPSNLLALLA